MATTAARARHLLSSFLFRARYISKGDIMAAEEECWRGVVKLHLQSCSSLARNDVLLLSFCMCRSLERLCVRGS